METIPYWAPALSSSLAIVPFQVSQPSISSLKPGSRLPLLRCSSFGGFPHHRLPPETRGVLLDMALFLRGSPSPHQAQGTSGLRPVSPSSVLRLFFPLTQRGLPANFFLLENSFPSPPMDNFTFPPLKLPVYFSSSRCLPTKARLFSPLC